MKTDYSHDIRSLVSKTGLDIKELAIAINASEKSIYKWIKGRSAPDFAHTRALFNLAYKIEEVVLEKETQ